MTRKFIVCRVEKDMPEYGIKAGDLVTIEGFYQAKWYDKFIAFFYKIARMVKLC
jgi:hypothetical protein